MDITTSATDLTAKHVPAEIDGQPRVITIHGDIHAPTIEVWSCRWWSMCPHDAVTVLAHTQLGDVPACEECATLAGYWGAPRKAGF